MYRLMIVEDDNGIAEAIKTQAEMWELQVHITENFRNVMTEFAEFEPHLVLLDIVLSGKLDAAFFVRLKQALQST